MRQRTNGRRGVTRTHDRARTAQAEGWVLAERANADRASSRGRAPTGMGGGGPPTASRWRGAGRVDAAGARRGLHTSAERDTRVSQRDPWRRKGSRGRGGRGRGRRARAGREGLSEPPAAGSADGTRRGRHSDAGQSFRPRRARCSGGVSPLRAELGPSFPRREASLGPIPGRAALPQEPEGPALATPAAAQRETTPLSFPPVHSAPLPTPGSRLPSERTRPATAAHAASRGAQRIRTPEPVVVV